MLLRLALPLALLFTVAACAMPADDTTAAPEGDALPVETDEPGGGEQPEPAPGGPGAGAPAGDDGGATTDTDAPGATVTDAASGVTVEGDLESKPAISLPGGEPPAELVIVDVVEGDGAQVPRGGTVTTHYVGVSWANEGAEFDASWGRGAPLTFPLSGVIQGWTEGIPGMRAGGRRLLVIPPGLGYGSQSPTPAIASQDTLVFVIDLVDFE